MTIIFPLYFTILVFSIRKNKIIFISYTCEELIYKIHLRMWILQKDLVVKWNPIKYKYIYHPWVTGSSYTCLSIEYLLSYELKKSSGAFKLSTKVVFWKWMKSHLVFELSFKPLDFAHIFYPLSLLSACVTWFPVRLFPPFVHRHFLLTIHHSEKGMSLNCQIVLRLTKDITLVFQDCMLEILKSIPFVDY